MFSSFINYWAETEHLFKTTGTTNSFVFKGCTPINLPYSKCPVDDDIVDEDDLRQNRRLFQKTKTTTSTVTATVTVPTTGLCAKLVNVTGRCRRRKALWIEDPIVMTFDDDMEALDAAFSPTSIYRYRKRKCSSKILFILKYIVI